jgi:hypothetical protein
MSIQRFRAIIGRYLFALFSFYHLSCCIKCVAISLHCPSLTHLTYAFDVIWRAHHTALYIYMEIFINTQMCGRERENIDSGT